jgi:hypothetical protein
MAVSCHIHLCCIDGAERILATDVAHRKNSAVMKTDSRSAFCGYYQAIGNFVKKERKIRCHGI